MRRWLWIALGAATLSVASLGAHHGYAGYQQDVVVVLEGTIQEMRFSDPHTLLQIAAVDGSYTVEWRAATQLASMGIDERTFRPGQYLVLTGSPSINPRAKRLSLVREIIRPDDGWRWQIEDGRLSIDVPQ